MTELTGSAFAVSPLTFSWHVSTPLTWLRWPEASRR